MTEKSKTYLVLSNYDVSEDIKKKFEEEGVSRKEFEDNSSDFYDYIYTDGIYQAKKSLYNVKSDKRNVSTNHRLFIGNKAFIYEKLDRKISRKYMMKQYKIHKYKSDLGRFEHMFKYESIWILKPVSGYKGLGIKIVRSHEELKNHIGNTEIRVNNSYGKVNKNLWVLAKYIVNPLTYNGSKFHIRMYMIIENRRGKIFTYLMRYGYLIIANHKYSMHDFYDSDKHNIHLDNAYCDVFPYAYKKKYGIENTSKFIQDLKIIVKGLSDISDIRPYVESKSSFTVYGLDLMVDEKFNTILIECNAKPGLKFVSSNKFLRDIYSSFIVKLMMDKKVKDVAYIIK